MRKFLSAFLVLVLALVLIGCKKQTNKTEEILKKASQMTEEELLKAAKEEIGTNKLRVQTLAAGVIKSAEKFKEKYGINYDEEEIKSVKKDADIFRALEVVNSGEYFRDVVIAQDIRSIKQFMEEKTIYSYKPKMDDPELKLVKEDADPLAFVYYNKLFLYNKKDTTFTIKNVWQLAGPKTEDSHIKSFSFQSPVNEKINMNFLAMLTSPVGIKKLTEAYKAYWGKDYVEDPQYKNIAYKFISELLDSVTSWHSSDTTAAKETLVKNNTDINGQRTIFFVGLAKHKNIAKTLDSKDINHGNELANEILGWQHEVEGFSGFLYKQYVTIPKTAKYPYTACLFSRFLLTEAGFNAAFGKQYGYYSPNENVKSLLADDKTIGYWKQHCISEDPNFMAQVKNDLTDFIRSKSQNK